MVADELRRQADDFIELSELAPLIARQIFDAIRTLNRQDGLTVLIVEQNAAQALAISDRAYVIESGTIVLTGTGAELAHDDRVKAAYLGI